jgi:hypothetical protein
MHARTLARSREYDQLSTRSHDRIIKYHNLYHRFKALNMDALPLYLAIHRFHQQRDFPSLSHGFNFGHWLRKLSQN